MILLVGINAKYIHSNLGVYCIQAYARKRGITDKDLQIKEYTINQEVDFILGDIYLQKPEMIGFSCYIWNIDFVTEITKELKKIMPDVPIWLGGPEVSYDSDRQLEKYPWIDGIMSGEGEVTFYEMLQYYLSDGGRKKIGDNIMSLSDIKGIVYRDGDKTVINETRPRMCMDEIPFPYTEDVGFDIESLKNRIIYYETSRGCPYGCSYCLSSVDKKVRFRKWELVEKELKFFIDMKVPQVKFVDRTFNCDHEHTMKIWKYINEHDNGITNFHFELSAELLTDEEIDYVSGLRPGLVQFEIGVQTANKETLKAIHRNPDLTVLKQKVAKIREKRNIHQHLDLIVGLPYEDYASFRESYNTVYSMKPDQLQLGFLKVLKGSPIYYDREEFGIVYQDRAPYEVLFTKWISYEDVLRLKGVEEMVEVYYNSRQFTNTMEELEKEYDSAFDMYDRLAAYYEENDYNSVQHKRSARYEILLNYVRKYHKEKEDLFREVLTYDYYLRENAKSRPGFAGEYPVTKDAARAFYETEEETHEYLPDYGKYDRNQMRKMTHLEYFKLTDTYILFDYQNRNPLNQEARVCKIEKIKL